MQMQEKHEEVLRVLKDSGLVRETAEERGTAPMQATPPLQEPSPTTRTGGRSGPKPATPSDFDGDRTKGRAFLNSVKWYLRSRGHEFRDTDHMISWTLSFMKEGRALTFAHQVTRQTDRTGFIPYKSWEEFWKELEHRFLPVDEAEDAINILETDRYFQGKQTVDDYCDKFQDLIDHAGYGDGRQVVMKFRKGLDTEVADRVAMLQEKRPKDEDIAGWITMAKEVARQHIRNEAFNQAIRKDKADKTAAKTSTVVPPKGTPFFRLNPQTPKPILPFSFNRPNLAPLKATPAAPIPPPPKPISTGPIPMEVDASYNRGRVPIVCHRCGQPGHYKNQCPRRFDVRFMSTDEIEDLLQDQFAAQDVAEAGMTGDGAEMEEKSEEGTKGNEEGFPRSCE
jgi:hypothetical protein